MPPSSTRAPARSGAWKARWLELTLLAAAIVIVIVCLTRVWTAPLELVLLLAVVPALAGIGAVGMMRPLVYGVIALIAGLIVDALVRGGITVTGPTHALPLAAIGGVVVVTALSATGAAAGLRRWDTQQVRKDEQFVNVTSVAEAAQRAVLRQLPETVGPLTIGVVYQAAAAEARVGGDLYEVADTEYGIRVIIGDVRGKGLGAVEVAADIIGRFRELAYSVHTLDEIAYRLDAGLSRRFGPQEEFVTALLVRGQLLLYTDGVTEARDAGEVFYPLEERVAVLAPQAQPESARAAARRTGPSLLDLVRDDLLRHVGSPPHDDAAMLLIRAPAAWPNPARARPRTGLIIRTDGV